MNTTRLTQARRLFNSEFMDKHQNRELRRRWVRSLRMLGDKWLLANKQEKQWKQ